MCVQSVTSALCLLLVVFALLAVQPANADPVDLVKWSQLPEMGPYGYDFSSETTVSSMVADDFLCSSQLAVADLHWWGSYYQPGALWPYPNSDNLPDPTLATGQSPGMLTGFNVEFYTDVPVGVDPLMPWSHPGTLLYEEFIGIAQVTETLYGTVTHIGGVKENVWQYNLDLPTPFAQNPNSDPVDVDGDGVDDGTIYWLKIQAVHTTGQIQWGWHEADSLWHDNAVQYWEPDQSASFWDLLPNKDMAFELTVIPEPSLVLLGAFALVSSLLARRKR